MYTPRSFREDDPAVLFEFMRRHAFATLFSAGPDGPQATHLPFMVETDGQGRGVLIAHMARANPHWRAFDGRSEVLVTFLGPHAYISPGWYETKVTVPTWNYAAVHVRGVPRIIQDMAVLREQVERLARLYESGQEEPWDVSHAEPIMESQLRAIVGFEIPVAGIEGKFKFNQNRSRADQEGVIAALERRTDPELRAVAEIMRNNLR